MSYDFTTKDLATVMDGIQKESSFGMVNSKWPAIRAAKIPDATADAIDIMKTASVRVLPKNWLIDPSEQLQLLL